MHAGTRCKSGGLLEKSPSFLLTGTRLKSRAGSCGVLPHHRGLGAFQTTVMRLLASWHWPPTRPTPLLLIGPARRQQPWCRVQETCLQPSRSMPGNMPLQPHTPEFGTPCSQRGPGRSAPPMAPSRVSIHPRTAHRHHRPCPLPRHRCGYPNHPLSWSGLPPNLLGLGRHRHPRGLRREATTSPVCIQERPPPTTPPSDPRGHEHATQRAPRAQTARSLTSSKKRLLMRAPGISAMIWRRSLDSACFLPGCGSRRGGD